jgi:SAM-dependent methyltransferase
MDESVYHLHYQQEESHWWFAARMEIIDEIIRTWGNLKPGDTILDIGCGTGAILKRLSDRYNVVGIDMSPLAVKYSKKRGLTDVFEMPAEEFPKDKYNVKAALLLDVIEHIEDDISVLKAAREIVGPDGRVIITVPAYQWMWSAHDTLHHHYRRYNESMLRAVLDNAGLEPIKVTYYNTLLFPLAAVKKLLDRKKDPSIQNVTLDQPPTIVNKLFKTVFASERRILPSRGFPFGVSLLAVARPKTDGAS